MLGVIFTNTDYFVFRSNICLDRVWRDQVCQRAVWLGRARAVPCRHEYLWSYASDAGVAQVRIGCRYGVLFGRLR